VSKKLLIIGAVIFIAISFPIDYAILSHPYISTAPTPASAPVTKLVAENLPSFQPIRALFVGDIMLDRSVANHATQYGATSLFANIRSLFDGNDITVGNLEGAITSQPSVSQNGSGVLRFTFNPQLVRDT
jgi:hypothetical protein